jgi:hypothetical protein
MPPLRVGIATEGRSSAEILEAICQKRHVRCRARPARGKDRLFKDFDTMLMNLRDEDFNADTFLVVPDLHPEISSDAEAQRWNESIEKRFPEAHLCLAVWEIEAWLMADVDTLRNHFGLDIEDIEPDRIGEPRPSERLEQAFRRKKRYVRGSAYDKRADGVEIASKMDLEAAVKRSPSLRRFLGLLRE